MIRVRELLDFIQRNPSLVDYDAPLWINASAPSFDIKVTGLALGQNSGRLALAVDVDTDAALCDHCKDQELQEMQDKIEDLEEKIKGLEEKKKDD